MTSRRARLAEVLRSPPPTDEQVAVIEAPLRPCRRDRRRRVRQDRDDGRAGRLAGRQPAWSRPDEVLGLTFTRKAAAELASRIRRRLAQWRGVVERDEPTTPDYLAALLAGEPTVLTYAAYAGRLVGEHALRLGREPSPRLLSQAVRWQLADAVVRRYDGDLPRRHRSAGVRDPVRPGADRPAAPTTWSRPTSVAGVAAAALAEWDALPPVGRESATPRRRPVTTSRPTGHRRHAHRPLVRAFEPPKAVAGGVDYGDQMSLAAAARAGCRRSRWPSGSGTRPCCSTSTRTPGTPRSTLLRGAVRRRPSGHRGRRPAPVDLRLARRGRGQHRPVRDDVPARRRHPRRPCSRWRPAGATTSAILAAANVVAARL